MNRFLLAMMALAPSVLAAQQPTAEAIHLDSILNLLQASFIENNPDMDGLANQPSFNNEPILVWEEVMVHSEGPLAGMRTVRLQLNLENEDDWVSSVYGDATDPSFIHSTSTPAWYNHPSGIILPNGCVESCLPFFSEAHGAIQQEDIALCPLLEFDSWLTIGFDSYSDTTPSTMAVYASPGPDDLFAMQAMQDDWGFNMNLNSAVGDTWFNLNEPANNPSNHPGYAGADLQVLLAQFTTAGELSGQLNVQIFYGGNGQDEGRFLLDLPPWPFDPLTPASSSNSYHTQPGFNPDSNGDACYTSSDLIDLLSLFGTCGLDDSWPAPFQPFSGQDSCYSAFDLLPFLAALGTCHTIPDIPPGCNLDDFGCTDPEACNFDSNALEDDGSCTYPIPGAGCPGECAGSSFFPGTGGTIEVEVVNPNIGILSGALGTVDLTGHACYRIYIHLNNTSDFLSSVSGDATNPTYIETTTNFYNSDLGAGVPNGINSLLFSFYPGLAYDSWVTIGLEREPNVLAGEASISTIQSTTNPWLTNFDPGGGLPGGNIAIDDEIGGAWYALNGDSNGVAGDDLKVLIGQFTTTGNISGELTWQFFANGIGCTGCGFESGSFVGPACNE